MADAVGGAVNIGTYVALVTPIALYAELSALAMAAGTVAGLASDYSASGLWVF